MGDIGVPNFEDTPEGRRYAIQYQIAQWRFEQWSGDELLGWLQGAGLGIRSSDFYSIRRDRLAGPPYQDDLLSYNDNEIIPLAWMENQPSWNMRTQFMYVSHVVLRDRISGETRAEIRMTGSNSLLTKDEVYEELDYLNNEIGMYIDTELISANVIRGYRKF